MNRKLLSRLTPGCPLFTETVRAYRIWLNSLNSQWLLYPVTTKYIIGKGLGGGMTPSVHYLRYGLHDRGTEFDSCQGHKFLFSPQHLDWPFQETEPPIRRIPGDISYEFNWSTHKTDHFYTSAKLWILGEHGHFFLYSYCIIVIPTELLGPHIYVCVYIYIYIYIYIYNYITNAPAYFGVSAPSSLIFDTAFAKVVKY